LHTAENQGNVDAQFTLGIMFRAGLGVQKNKAEAENLFRKAAEQEDSSAVEKLQLIEDDTGSSLEEEEEGEDEEEDDDEGGAG